MRISLSLDKMTVVEKLQTMEEIWSDLQKATEEIPSPAWHADVLQARSDRVRAGSSQFSDWTGAKGRIREQTGGRFISWTKPSRTWSTASDSTKRSKLVSATTSLTPSFPTSILCNSLPVFTRSTLPSTVSCQNGSRSPFTIKLKMKLPKSGQFWIAVKIRQKSKSDWLEIFPEKFRLL